VVDTEGGRYRGLLLMNAENPSSLSHEGDAGFVGQTTREGMMAERPIGIPEWKDSVSTRSQQGRGECRYPTRASIRCVRSSFDQVTRERSQFIDAHDDAAVIDVNAVALSHHRSMNEAETVAR